MAIVEFTRTVASLERVLSADAELAAAAEIDPRLEARATKLRREGDRLVKELGAVMASSSAPARPDQLAEGVDRRNLEHLTARLECCHRRMASLTYDAALVDLGAPG